MSWNHLPNALASLGEEQYIRAMGWMSGVAIAVLAAVAPVGALQFDNTLPSAVQSAVEARFPDLPISSFEREEEQGQLVYEVKLRDDARRVEAEFAADGTFLNSEENLYYVATPKVVQTPFEAAYPTARPHEVTRYVRSASGGDVVTYVLEVRTSGVEHEMGIDASGKVLFDRIDN